MGTVTDRQRRILRALDAKTVENGCQPGEAAAAAAKAAEIRQHLGAKASDIGAVALPDAFQLAIKIAQSNWFLAAFEAGLNGDADHLQHLDIVNDAMRTAAQLAYVHGRRSRDASGWLASRVAVRSHLATMIRADPNAGWAVTLEVGHV